MAVLTVQSGTGVGLTPAYGAAAAGGDTFTNQANAVVKVRNANTATVEVTIPAVTACNQNHLHPIVVSVPPNEATPTEIGPVGFQYQSTTSVVSINYSLTDLAPPTGAPHVLDPGAAGNPNGAYLTKVTFVGPAGESPGGPEVAITVASLQILWKAIPLGPAGTTARKLYRTVAAGATGTEKLVTTIADNTTTTFTDNVADATIAAAAVIPTAVIGSVTVAVTAP